MPEVAERSTVETLKAARERITPPSSWACEEFAYDADGGYAHPNAPDACKWCAVGALLAELDLPSPDFELDELPGLYELAIGFDPDLVPGDADEAVQAIAKVNDRGFHSSVLMRFDRAIQLAEQETTNA